MKFTLEQMQSLPIGPTFSYVEYRITDVDRNRGYIEYNGKQIRFSQNCATINFPQAPNLICTFWQEDESMGFTDIDGVRWIIGQYAGGSFYRMLA